MCKEIIPGSPPISAPLGFGSALFRFRRYIIAIKSCFRVCLKCVPRHFHSLSLLCTDFTSLKAEGAQQSFVDSKEQFDAC